MGMHRDSLSTRILKVLDDGPATSVEVAAELDRPVNLTNALLQYLCKKKFVRRTGRFDNQRKERGRPAQFWELA